MWAGCIGTSHNPLRNLGIRCCQKLFLLNGAVEAMASFSG
ncbi:unnamed protein product [Victoria cruziana]